MSVGGWSRALSSPGFKFFLVGALVILLLIPLGLVWLVLYDRQTRAQSVQAQIAADWGGAQRIHGPYLIVPYTVRVETVQGDKVVETVQERRAVFLPNDVRFAGKAETEIRRRSIYDVTVYGADIAIEGRFAAADIAQVEAETATVRWQDAVLALGISDVSGLRESVRLELDGGRSLDFEPSLGVPNSTVTGIHARLAPAAGTGLGAFGFRVQLALNGSSSLAFAPVGRETEVRLASSWPHPSFTGGFLPIERDISANGFSAVWRVPHLARSVPQSWVESGGFGAQLDRFTGYDMGVSFFVPVDFYSLVDRAAKYGFMFLVAAFGAVFVLELMSGRRVHAVQYIFVGLGMVMFYLLLLSFAEHIGFTVAYVLASLATGGMISIYVAKALESARRGYTMMAVFLVLYGLLYLILQLEDYALLAGAIAGFVLLTATMFATLRVDWSGAGPTAVSGAMQRSGG
jgi:inner membrane protein